MPSAFEIIARTERLPSMPAAYYRVKAAIDDPNGSVALLAEAMAADPALTARILRIVNSPYYGYPGRIETVSRALNILGMQHVHDLVLAWAISTAFVGVSPARLSMDTFWRKSVARAVAARQLARHARFVDTERLFVEGLISDIGHLAIYLYAPELAFAARRRSLDTGEPLHEVERELLGSDYAEVGAALVTLWNLPESFEEPIRCQIAPLTATRHQLEATMLHVAAAIAETADSAALSVAPAVLAVLGIEPEQLAQLRSRVATQTAGVVSAFFPHLAAA